MTSMYQAKIPGAPKHDNQQSAQLRNCKGEVPLPKIEEFSIWLSRNPCGTAVPKTVKLPEGISDPEPYIRVINNFTKTGAPMDENITGQLSRKWAEKKLLPLLEKLKQVPTKEK